MELDDAVLGRRMCRRFLDRPVPPDVVDRLVARAARAPSAGHTQGWDWLVLEGPEQTGAFWRLDADPAWLAAPDHPGLLRAPVVIVPLAHRGAYLRRYAEPDKTPTAGGPSTWQVPYWLTDTAFATMILLLGVVDEGLGALFFALHGDQAVTLAGLGVPADRVAIGAVALGWPDPDGRRPPPVSRPRRRDVAGQVHRGRW